MNKDDLKKIPTCQLVEELTSRIAVEHYVVEPYEPFKIEVSGKSKAPHTSGPARILYVYD